MKTLISLLLVLLISVSIQFAQDVELLASSDILTYKSTIVDKSDAKYLATEENYLVGLRSGNPGVEVSAAYFLGEMKSEKALLPLMKMFNETKIDGVKLVAAWSLLKIGDRRGVYLVKRECDIGKCNNIKCMLHFLYMDYCLKTYGIIDTN